MDTLETFRLDILKRTFVLKGLFFPHVLIYTEGFIIYEKVKIISKQFK